MNEGEDLYVGAQRSLDLYKLRLFQGSQSNYELASLQLEYTRGSGSTRGVLIELELNFFCREFYNWTGSTHLIHTVRAATYRILQSLSVSVRWLLSAQPQPGSVVDN